jgi:hypothetical protein
MVNFTGNDTAAQLASYISEGLLDSFGDPYLFGLAFLLLVVLFCYFVRLPLDGSAFLLFFAIMVLGLGGLLPMWAFFGALVLSALVLGWFVFKVFALK